MPCITIESGYLTAEQKSGLIKEITQAASRIMNTPPEFFFINIRELPDENIGIGGKPVDLIKKEYKEKLNPDDALGNNNTNQ